MPRNKEFDIYESDAGYVAITNPVRRQILVALEKGDCELPDLVEVTGRAKPTLSNLHVKELLGQGLVEELPHPTDGRKKVYRLKARRIGSSDVPIEQLRGAVKQYVAKSPLAFSLPFPAIVEILVEGSPREGVGLRAQARALGLRSAQIFPEASGRDLLTGVGQFLEREGVARPAKLDFDRLSLEVEVGDAYGGARLKAMAVLLAGFVEGVVESRLSGVAKVAAESRGGDRIEVALSI